MHTLLLNHLPKRTFIALWGVALARLLLPFELSSAFSIYSALERAAGAFGYSAASPAKPDSTAMLTQAASAALSFSGSASTVPQTVSSAVAAEAAGSATATQTSAISITFIWAIVAFACAAIFAAAYLRCVREFRTSLPANESAAELWLCAHPLRRPLSIRQSDRISSPLTYGVLRPVILMPKNTNWSNTETVKYVLAHEYTHVRRFDNLLKLLLTAAVCLHWFNPLVWAMYALANRDIELACDEAVVRSFDVSARGAYARALPQMDEKRRSPTPLCSAFGKNVIEERIVSIMKTRKTTAFISALACVLVLGVSLACGTTAATAAGSAASSGIAQSTCSLAKSDPELYEKFASGAITTYKSNDGTVTFYRIDDGSTIKTLRDSDFDALYPDLDIEWWTADEYTAWLSERMSYLNANLGQTITTDAGNEVTCTKELIEMMRSGYDSTLIQIENGMLLSKTKHGGTIKSGDFYYIPSGSYAVYNHDTGEEISGPYYYSKFTLSSTGESYTFGPY